jgi:cardiolipin synthase
MHQKVVLVDDDFASVGTANFDNRSFRLNFEIIAAIVDRGFASEVETMLEKDLEKCRPIAREEYVGRDFLFRLQVRVAYLLSQVM